MSGFWAASESDDNVSELKSYESNECNSEDSYEEEVEVEEEEADEIDESDNDIEVMEILAEATKQNQIEKRSEPTDTDIIEELKIITVQNSSSCNNISIADRSTPKVCIAKFM